jgi:hypothetical protein
VPFLLCFAWWNFVISQFFLYHRLLHSFFQCLAATIVFSQLHLLLEQVMALIAYLMEFKGNYGPHLIIVPNAVLVNWKVPFLLMLYFEEMLFFAYFVI